MSLLGRIRSMWNLDRRKRQTPVATERRTRHKRKDVEQRYTNAIEDFSETVRANRTDIVSKFSANDNQQVIIWSTFRDLCTHGLKAGEYFLCRHPKHEAANTGIAKCEQQVCPLIHAARNVA